MTRIPVYTDGSCHPNPGHGGWAFVAVDDPVAPLRQSGYKAQTTNNEMELLAILRALQWAQEERVPVLIYSDSQYALNCSTVWARAWRAKGWTKKGGEIRNLALIQQIYGTAQGVDVRWEWIRGHTGNRYNETADRLAEKARASRQGLPSKVSWW